MLSEEAKVSFKKYPELIAIIGVIQNAIAEFKKNYSGPKDTTYQEAYLKAIKEITKDEVFNNYYGESFINYLMPILLPMDATPQARFDSISIVRRIMKPAAAEHNAQFYTAEMVKIVAIKVYKDILPEEEFSKLNLKSYL